MSGSIAWFQPASPAGSTRLFMVGAVVGALVLLGSSVLIGWPVIGGSAANPERIVTDAGVGTCVTWTRSDRTDLREVDCSAPHLFEVTGTADISGQYPAGAALPDTNAWLKLSQTACGGSATAYVGKLDPAGKYIASALKPNTSLWNSGDRALRCGLQSSTPTGGPQPSTGTAKGQDQSALWPAGTCLALVGKTPGGPVSCSDTHSYEIVGSVDLGPKFTGGYPSTDAQQSTLGDLCGPLSNAYTGNANLGTLGLTLTWNPIKEPSWDAGSHRANCEIGVVLGDGSGLGPLTNSVRGVGGGGTGSGH